MKDGNLERECIEEDCDVDELEEVYDNTEISGPMQLKYDQCRKITDGKTSVNFYLGVNSHDSNEFTPDDSSSNNVFRCRWGIC